MVKDVALGVGCSGLVSQAGQIGHRVATAATFLESFAAQALSCEGGPRHSLHA